MAFARSIRQISSPTTITAFTWMRSPVSPPSPSSQRSLGSVRQISSSTTITASQGAASAFHHHHHHHSVVESGASFHHHHIPVRRTQISNLELRDRAAVLGMTENCPSLVRIVGESDTIPTKARRLHVFGVAADAPLLPWPPGIRLLQERLRSTSPRAPDRQPSRPGNTILIRQTPFSLVHPQERGL